MTQVFIIAPTAALRAGLRALLSSAEVQVVGEATTLSSQAALISGSDVIVAAGDAFLGDLDQSTVSDNAVALVVLSDDPRTAALLRRMPLPGWGIVSSDATAAELQATVMAAAQGMIVLPKPLAAALLSRSNPTEDLDEPLTTREREVLELLSHGLPNKLIAGELHISEHTVKFHISSIFTKLGATSRTEAVSRGARRGLITL